MLRFKVLLSLIAFLFLGDTIHACPGVKNVRLRNMCKDGGNSISFSTFLEECDWPWNGNWKYQAVTRGEAEGTGSSGSRTQTATWFNASDFGGAGEYKIRVAAEGQDPESATTAYRDEPWSEYSDFDVVRLEIKGYPKNPHETCLKAGQTDVLDYKIVPASHDASIIWTINDTDETGSSVSNPKGKLTHGDKPGKLKVHGEHKELSGCSLGLGTLGCCGDVDVVLYAVDSVTASDLCSQNSDEDKETDGEVDLKIITSKDHGGVRFSWVSNPAGYEDKIKIEDVANDGGANVGNPEGANSTVTFNKHGNFKFKFYCCSGDSSASCTPSSKVIEMSIDVNRYEVSDICKIIVKDNPVASKGFEVEDLTAEADRGDIAKDKDDEDTNKIEITVEGPQKAEIEIKWEKIDGFDKFSMTSDQDTNDQDTHFTKFEHHKIFLKGLVYSDTKDDVELRITAMIPSNSYEQMCAEKLTFTIVETETWAAPIVNNPRPFVNITSVEFLNANTLTVKGEIKDWTGVFIRNQVNNTSTQIEDIFSELDISIAQPYSASWVTQVPIRIGAGKSFVVTAVFQNSLYNFGSSTAQVTITQDEKGIITNAELVGDVFKNPRKLENINTFTVTVYDATGEVKPSFPWKVKASSGDEEDVETDPEAIEYPKFVSKSYALMLDNFNGDKPKYVLKAKPGDRIINLLESECQPSAEYTFSKGLHLGKSPIVSIALSAGSEELVGLTLGGEFGDAPSVDIATKDGSLKFIDFEFIDFTRISEKKLEIGYHKYIQNFISHLYTWDNQEHMFALLAEGGGEVECEIDDIKAYEPVLHAEIVSLASDDKKVDPATGPANIQWSNIRSLFFEDKFFNEIQSFSETSNKLIGVCVTNPLPIIELDTALALAPLQIKVATITIENEKRFFAEIPFKGIVRDVLANISKEAAIQYVSALNWDPAKLEMKRESFPLKITDEKVSPAKPEGHLGVFDRKITAELKHGKNYIRVISGRNALGASSEAFYEIDATEDTIGLTIDKVTVLNNDDLVINWSPYFANMRNGLLNKDSVPDTLTVAGIKMKTDHLYNEVDKSLNFKSNPGNNWSSQVFTVLPFPAKKPNTDYDLPLNVEINPDFGFISNAGSAPFEVSANDLASNKVEVFSVDLAIKDLKPEDEADKGFYVRKTENVSEPKSDCQPEYPVLIDLKTSAIVKKLLDNNKGELKLEVIKSKRTPNVSLSIKLANGQKTVDGSIKITDPNQQIEVLGLENGVAELKLSYKYEEFYTQDIIRINVCEITFIEPYSDSPLIPIKIFQPKAFFSNIFIKTIPQKNIAIISGTIEDWSGDVDLNSLFCNGNLVNGGSIELISSLNIHGTIENESPVASKGFFQFNLNLPNSLVRDFNISLVYRNKVGFYSEYNSQVSLVRDNKGFVSTIYKLLDYSYPNSLEDIRPYLFRVYLFDPSSENNEKVNVTYQIKDLSGTNEVVLEPYPSLSPKHYSRRKVLIPDGTRGNFNQNEINNDILIGWPGSKPTVKYQLKTNQTIEDKNVAIGLICVDSKQTKPVFSVISNTNRSLVENTFRNNYFVVGGFYSNECSAPEKIEANAQSLTDLLNFLEKPDNRYLEPQKLFQLKRVGSTVKAGDYFYYNLENKNGFLAIHTKGNLFDDSLIMPIYTHGGFQKFAAEKFETSVKVIRTDIFINEGDKNNNSIYSVPEYISNSDNKPKLTVKALIKNREISNDGISLVQNFIIKGQVEDEYAELTNTLDGQIRYISIADNVINVKNISNPKALSENRPYPYLGAFDGEFKLKLVEGENNFLIRTGENIFQHDDIIPLTINTVKRNNKLIIDNFKYEPVEVEMNQKRFILGLTGGVQLFDNQNKSIIVNEKQINLFHENRPIIKDFLQLYVDDTYSNGVNIFAAYPALKTKLRPDDAQGRLEFPSIIETKDDRFEINRFNEDKSPYHYADIAKLDIVGKTIEGKVVENEHEISSGLNSPLFDKNTDIKLRGKAPSFTIKFNQQQEFVNPKSKFVLTLFGKNDISVFMNDKEILNQNIKVFELKGIDFNNEFVVYGYQYGMNYLKLEFLLNNKSVTYDLVRLKSGSNGFVDVDVDSDNNNYFLPPDSTLAEDKLEDKKNEPGKYINVNGDDEDGDGTPDYADGFNLDGIVGNADDISSGDRFIPIMIEVPAEVRLQDIKLTLTYEHSGAISVKRSGAGTRDDPYGYSKEKNSTLRIWTKDGNQRRNLNEINKNGQGDFVPSKTYEDVSILGFKNNKRIITLYMEGLAEKHPDGETIKVEMTFDNGDYYTDEVKVLVFDLNIGTDGNRDGTIDFSDPVDQNIDFWVNNDIDANYRNTFEPDIFDVTYAEDDLNKNDFFLQNIPFFNRIDFQDDWIGKTIRFDDTWLVYKVVNGCLRDLEDLAKLKLGTVNKHILSSNTEFYLRIKKPNILGLRIGIFKAFNDNLSYLSVKRDGEDQIKEKKLFTVNSKLQTIDKKLLSNKDDLNFLFEGEGEGVGHLVFGVKLNGKIIYERGIPIELRDIKTFYLHYQVDKKNFSSIEQKNANFQNKSKLAPMIVYVHGWNMAGTDARWAETMFKRLYWQGSNGHVCLFDWNDLGATEYDNSEENAWNSADALRKVMNDIRKSGHQGEISILGHSQGNIVVGEYLRTFANNKEFSIKTYITTQGAISAHFYDNKILPDFFTNIETPNIYGHFTDGIGGHPYMFENVRKTKIYNFYNEQDWALIWWRDTNILRPNNLKGFHYSEGDSNLNTYYPDLGDAFKQNLTKLSLSKQKERYKIFAQCSESRSLTLGATTGNVNGFSGYFDLSKNIGYTGQHYSHSREFRSNIIDENQFWAEVFRLVK